MYVTYIKCNNFFNYVQKSYYVIRSAFFLDRLLHNHFLLLFKKKLRSSWRVIGGRQCDAARTGLSLQAFFFAMSSSSYHSEMV